MAQLTKQEVIRRIGAMKQQGASPDEIQRYLDQLSTGGGAATATTTATPEPYKSPVIEAINARDSGKSLLGFIGKDVRDIARPEDRPGGLLKGFAAEAFQTTLGSKGVLGLAEAPFRPIRTMLGAKKQVSLQEQRLQASRDADAIIAEANRTADPTRKNQLLTQAAAKLRGGEEFGKQAKEVNKRTPQSTSTLKDIERVGGQAINTALTLAPFGKPAQAVAGIRGTAGATKVAQVVGKQTLGGAVKAGAVQGAKYGAGYGLGTALAEEKSAGQVAKKTATGAATGAVVGGVLGGVGYEANKFISKRAVSSQEERQLLEGGEPDARVAGKRLDEQGRIVRDREALDAIRQGVPDNDVALIKNSTPKDREKMIKMLDTRKLQATNKRITARASDVPGNTALDRVRFIQEANRNAAKRVDLAAQKLSGKQVDSSEAFQQFAQNLEDAGVTIGEKGKLGYDGSDFEGLPSVQRTIDNVWSRALKVQESGDAMQLHRTKRFIDNQVEWGAEGQGLPGRAEGILKSFRRNSDQVLDANFPTYNRANTDYAETVNELNKFGQVMGRRFKINEPLSDAQTGITLRRILSNTKSRGEILQVLESNQKVAQKFGMKVDEDVVNQVMFADTLEKMFGSEAPTSFLGQGERFLGEDIGKLTSAGGDIVRGHPIGAAMKVGKFAFEKTRGISQERRIAALEALLRAAGRSASVFGRRVIK